MDAETRRKHKERFLAAREAAASPSPSPEEGHNKAQPFKLYRMDGKRSHWAYARNRRRDAQESLLLLKDEPLLKPR